MFSTVASSALGVLFWLVGARVYTPTELGRAAAAVSAITLISGLAQLSLSTALVRFLPTAGRAAGRMIGYGQVAVTSLSVIFAAGFWLLGLGAAYLPSGRGAFLLFCATVAAVTVTGVHDGAFTGLGATQWVPARTVSSAVARLALIIALAGAAVGAPVLLAWSLPTVAVAVFTGAVLLVPRLRTARVPAPEVLPTRRDLTHFVGSQYLSGIVSGFASYAPPLIVTAVLGPAVNGSSFYVPWLILTVAVAMSWNVVVAFVVAASRGASEVRQHLWHALRLLIVINVGGGVVLAVGAPYILGVLGPQYAQGGTTALRIIGLAMPFMVIGFLFGAAAIINNRPWSTLWLGLAGTSTFLGGAYWAVGDHGVTGVALAYLVSEVVVGVAVVPATVRQLRALVAVGDRLVTTPAPAAARGVASVPRVGPGTEAGPLTIVFFPPDVGQWLASAETVYFPRPGSPAAETTASLPRQAVSGEQPATTGDGQHPSS